MEDVIGIAIFCVAFAYLFEIVVIVALIIRAFTRNQTLYSGYAHKANQVSSANSTLTRQELNIDNDYFLIRNGCLLEYRGRDDSIIVPRGVKVIGANGKNIWSKTVHAIFLPNTVYKISDFALPYVETVFYEGPQEQLHYDKQYNFYADGWIPDWSKPEPVHVRVNTVSFHFNNHHHDAVARDHYALHPDELAPRKFNGMLTFADGVLSEKDSPFANATFKDGVVYHNFKFEGYQPIGFYKPATDDSVAEYNVFRDKDTLQRIGFLQNQKENIWLSRDAIHNRFKVMEASDAWKASGMKAKHPMPPSKIVAELHINNSGGVIFDKETGQFVASYQGDPVGAAAAFIALSSELHRDTKYNRFLVDWDKC